MTYSKLFITGCDKQTEWMLPWFVDNFKKHNPDADLLIYDFGMEANPYPEMTKSLLGNQDSGWFKKPATMIDASKLANHVCWLDTDCEVRDNLDGVWSHIESNKLAMVEDVPWSTRHGEMWHNSGVVAFRHRPNILDEWASAVAANPVRGDQEVLHLLVREGIRRLIHISSLPREYNTLRLDLTDDTAPSQPKIMHWTGQKGKKHIREIMND
jgi:hypothetical protein